MLNTYAVKIPVQDQMKDKENDNNRTELWYARTKGDRGAQLRTHASIDLFCNRSTHLVGNHL